VFQPLPTPNFGQLPPLPPLVGGGLKAVAAEDDAAAAHHGMSDEAQGQVVEGHVPASEDGARDMATAMENLSVGSQVASGDAGGVEHEQVESTLPVSEW